MSKAIKQIDEAMNGNVAFVWATIGDGGLADQSRQSLIRYLNRTGINVYSLDEALSACPNSMAGNVVVINWEAINKTDELGNPINRAMKDGDKINFPQMCASTRSQCPIVLFIDEEHTHAGTPKSLRLWKEIIAPTYTVLASATPTSKGDISHEVSRKDVIRSGLIKKKVIAPEFATHKDGILMAANHLIKMIDLAKMCGANYLPKMLVFVPNADKHGRNGEVEDILSILKDRLGWTQEGGDIKLWFSGAKDTNACKQNLNSTKVIITKEAIDTGIDIPSIQMIVQLRSTKNVKVQVQKLGRGARMPEQKHYKNDLDHLYFFIPTNTEVRFDEEGSIYDKDDFENSSEIKVRDTYKVSVSQFPILHCNRVERATSFIESGPDDFADDYIQSSKN